MGASLTELAINGTDTVVTNKIKAVKHEKSAAKLLSAYDDIEHLHNTVSRILEIVKVFRMVKAKAKGQDEVEKVTAKVESYEQNKELISVDTLKTM
jgi:SHS2 domain-containing protein